MKRTLVIALALVAATHAGPGKQIQRAVREAIALLKSRRAESRSRGARQLAGIGPDARSAVPHLARAIADGDGDVRYWVATALRKIGEGAVPGLIKALKSKDPQARASICEVLASKELVFYCGAPAKKLVIVLKDPDAGVREGCVDGLAAYGPPAVAGLVKRLDSANDHERASAIEACYRTGRPAINRLHE